MIATNKIPTQIMESSSASGWSVKVVLRTYVISTKTVESGLAECDKHHLTSLSGCVSANISYHIPWNQGSHASL